MTTEEMREMDAWIAQNLFGWVMLWRVWGDRPLKAVWKSKEDASENGGVSQTVTEHNNPKEFFHDWNRKVPHYTTDPASALEVLKRCVHLDDVVIYKTVREKYGILSDITDLAVDSETIELAICLFAKRLFSSSLTRMIEFMTKEELNVLAMEAKLESRRAGVAQCDVLLDAGWRFELPEIVNRKANEVLYKTEPWQWYWRAPAKRKGQKGRRYNSTNQAFMALQRSKNTV